MTLNQMPEFCRCESKHSESYQDNLGRTVRKFECGAVWLEPVVGQAMAVSECPKFKAAIESLKQWVDTRR